MIDSSGVFVTTCDLREWSAPDGELFPYSLWKSGTSPRAFVIAVHGLSGAALDFEPLGRHLAPLGFHTYALELRGQGNDPVKARRGDLARLEDWYADLRAFVDLVRAEHRGAPLFLYGESLGAALLTRYLAQEESSRQPNGLILASPVVRIPNDPGRWRRFVFHFFTLVTPMRRINVSKYTERRDENDPKHWVTRNPAHRQWFDSASHKITSFTFRFFKCVFDLIGGCFEAAARITVPTLVVYAARDVFIPPAKVEQFFGALGAQDKELELFPESYHLLLHDFDQASALQRIEVWLAAHTA